MPHRFLNSKVQLWLLRSDTGVPMWTALIGVLLTLYTGFILQKGEIRSRASALNATAQDYSKRLELTMLNSTLRVQSMLDTYGPSGDRIVSQRRAIEEILRHTIFERVTLLKAAKTRGDSSVEPVLNIVYASHLAGDELPKNESSILTSGDLLEKIMVMNQDSRQNALTVSSIGSIEVLHLIWHSTSNPREYILFSTPLQSLVSKVELKSALSALITEDDVGRQTLVELSDRAQIEVIGGFDNVQRRLHMGDGIPMTGSESQFSSLKVDWIGRPDRSLGDLTWVVWICGLLITALVSLLLRFILDQNRKVADLVVSRTVDLEAALDDATEANLAKTRFLANVSHELRTPLNIILGMIDMVEERVSDTKAVEFLKAMRVSGDQLMALISDLLGVARREHSRSDLSIKNVAIKCVTFFEEIVRLLAQDCQQKGLELKFEIAPDVPAALRGDPARLRQILINLLRNAIKYTVRGHVELKVSVLKTDAESGQITLRMSVTDTGVGIPRTKRQQIFDRFLQLESTKVLSQGGVGLGLSIVKDLIEAMNGNISVESQEGHGSTFTVDLNFETVERQSWLEVLSQSLKAPLKIAMVSEREGFFIPLRLSLKSPRIELHELTAQDYQALLAKDPKLSGFTHLFLDFALWPKIYSIMPESPQNRVFVLGPEPAMLKDPRTRRWRIIDNSPLLPMQLWKNLGARVQEAKPRVPANETTTVQPSEARNRKLSVLIADDDVGNRHLFAAYFAEFDWRLDFTENGQEALERYRLHPPDVVIADLRMPVMDGFEMTDHVRAFEAAKNLKNVPIILVTADALDETANTATKHGVTAFLTKPIRKAKIVDAVLSVTNVT